MIQYISSIIGFIIISNNCSTLSNSYVRNFKENINEIGKNMYFNFRKLY